MDQVLKLLRMEHTLPIKTFYLSLKFTLSEDSRPFVLLPLDLLQLGDFLQLLLHHHRRLVNPLQCVHVRVEHLADLNHGVALVLTAVGRVEVLDDLAEVAGHALQLGVEGLGELVGPFSLCVGRWGRGQGGLERPEDVLQLGLLAFDEVKLMLETLGNIQIRFSLPSASSENILLTCWSSLTFSTASFREIILSPLATSILSQALTWVAWFRKVFSCSSSSSVHLLMSSSSW